MGQTSSIKTDTMRLFVLFFGCWNSIWTQGTELLIFSTITQPKKYFSGVSMSPVSSDHHHHQSPGRGENSSAALHNTAEGTDPSSWEKRKRKKKKLGSLTYTRMSSHIGMEGPDTPSRPQSTGPDKNKCSASCLLLRVALE